MLKLLELQQLLQSGLIALPVWGCVALTLWLTHITIVAVTIYLHRTEAHRALLLGPLLSHFFRFWLWFTTGMNTKEWVAIHRKHHAKCETEEDPHSPVVWLKGVEGRFRRFWRMVRWIFWDGVRKYVHASRDVEMIDRYGAGTPDDWIERNLYSKHQKLGIMLLFLLDVVLFGRVGVLIWLTQVLWIPVFAAGIMNGLGHFFGYRNFDTKHGITGHPDESRNIVRWGFVIGGEELHNNHHNDPTSAKFERKKFEFDLGWRYIRGLEDLELLIVKRR